MRVAVSDNLAHLLPKQPLLRYSEPGICVQGHVGSGRKVVLGLRIQIRVEGLGIRVWGLGFRVSG